MKTVRNGDRVSAGGGCEAAVTARTRCEWVKFRECGKLLYGRRFPLRPKGAVYKSYVRPAILYRSEAWCLKESEMGILRRTERSLVRAICGVQLRDRGQLGFRNDCFNWGRADKAGDGSGRLQLDFLKFSGGGSCSCIFKHAQSRCRPGDSPKCAIPRSYLLELGGG